MAERDPLRDEREGRQIYQSPLDGKLYDADWRMYQPINPPGTVMKGPSGRVEKQAIRLLSSQEEFARSIEVPELADFIRKTEKAVESVLEATNDEFELLVQTRLAKDEKPIFEMASKGDVSEDVLQRVYDALEELPDHRSRKDELKYEMRFAVRKTP